MSEDQFPSASERAQRFFASTPEPDALIEDVLDDAYFQAARDMDPTLRRVAELRLRLVGPRVRDGIYDPAVEERLAGPLGKELAAAGDPKMEQTRLGLVGISAGSVVLHYRPMVAELSNEGDQAGLAITPADAAVRRVLRLHDLFEREAPAAEIVRAARENEALLRGARGVVETLRDFDLDLSATWWSPSGDMVRSTLTKRGRDHASVMFAKAERDEPEQVWGLVSALDVDGFVTVRRQTTKTQVRVPREQVAEFALGERVHLLVLRTAHVDQVGLQRRKVEHTLVDRLAPDPHLDWDAE